MPANEHKLTSSEKSLPIVVLVVKDMIAAPKNANIGMCPALMVCVTLSILETCLFLSKYIFIYQNGSLFETNGSFSKRTGLLFKRGVI